MAEHFGLSLKKHNDINLGVNDLIMNEKGNHMNVILKTKLTN
jgi:hypothetical protein